ncbi:aspartate aminotransferase family protein [Dongia soli]|uniref:Aspartate aminotransferase family protein n=1 Tax=Dongia soli TaxID=600628 RepID=A0ABU5EF75_9PROT|nr:aspartate aminotransferase family protein [Dongia soli]MDY0885055.1 aspartate aminotransferase family protein [Dongia soli]
MNSSLETALAEAESRFIAANPGSAERHKAASQAMPGGNTRTVLHFDPFPLAWRRGEGAVLEDIDGHRYIDFLGEYSAGLYGHSNPVILEAVRDALADGIVLGGPNAYEAGLASVLQERFPSLELLRFCNSGTEANMFAIQTARAATRRSKVMVFEGGYHGGVFYFRQGGMPLNLPIDWVIAPYNDIEGSLDLIKKHGKDLAAVLVEPMLGSGCLPADPAFLLALRESCTAHGIVLIFDEVMTSRLSTGGLQAALRITPDMTTLGKYIGGGMSFGAFGGRRDLMQRFDPARADAWPHAGTFNNNVLTMSAGLTGLTKIYTGEAVARLNAKGDRLRNGINDLARRHEAPLLATGHGSFVGLHFSDRPVTRPQDIDPAGEPKRKALHKLIHLDFIAAGIYMARRGYMALMLPLSDADIEKFLAATDEFMQSRQQVLS